MGNIGTVHRNRKEFAKALVKYRQVIDTLQDEGHLFEIADQYGSLAHIHAMTGDVVETVHWYGKAE